MSWFVVRSPHNWQEVKVRDKDVGRSVRDGDNQLFYVLPRSDGGGYYGSLTREGGPEQEQRYLSQLDKEESSQAVGEARTMHDARGKPRSASSGSKLVVVAVILVVVAAWAIKYGPLKAVWTKPPPPPPTNKP